MTKTDKVLNHLKLNGKINTWEAITLYRATRLSAIIYNLRHNYNMNITNETIHTKDKDGNYVTYDNYIYTEE